VPALSTAATKNGGWGRGEGIGGTTQGEKHITKSAKTTFSVFTK